MKKFLIVLSFLFLILFSPTLCTSQASYINITEEVVGTVPEFTWGANLHIWRPNDYVRFDGLPKSGITFGVVDMLLHTVFKDNEIPDFINLDRWMDAVKANNVEPDMIVGFMPTWLSRDGTNYAPPTNMTKYLELVEIAVNHVKDDATYYEIWGEPNLGDYRWHGTIIEYREFLVNVSQKIKNTDPDAVILAPTLSGIAPQFFDRDQTVQFIEEICVNASDYIDIYSFHTYDWPPETWPSHMDNYKQLLDQYGCGDKPLMMTESSIWKTEIKWDYRDVIQKAKEIKVLLDYDVKAQVHFPFNILYTTGALWHGLYNSSDQTFTPIGEYYQLVGENNLKFYGDRLKINSDIDDDVSTISFLSVKNPDGNTIVQLTNSYLTSRDVRVNFPSTKNITVYESSSDHDFSSSLYSGTDSRLDLTLKPYSVYLIKAESTIPSTTTIPTGQVTISGQLRNATSMIEADVILYNEGTSQVNTSDRTVDGNYVLGLWPGMYDLQYNVLEFFIPNFWIKFIPVSITSDLVNVVNYVTGYPSDNKVSFNIDITTDQVIQVHSEEKPQAVKANGIEMTEGTSPISANEWFYDPSENVLHMKVGLTTTTVPGIPTTSTTTTIPGTTTTSTSSTTTTTTTILSGYIFEDSFELEDFDNWTGIIGTPTVVSTQKYEGTHSLEGDSSNDFVYKDFTGQTTVFVRGYFRFSELPTTSGQFRFLRLGYGSGGWGSLIARLIIEWTGTHGLTLHLQSGYPDSTFSYPISMDVNTWYPFEIKFVKHATNGEYRVWFDGNEVITITGLDTSGAGDATKIALGNVYTSAGLNTIVWVDSVKVANGYIGLE